MDNNYTKWNQLAPIGLLLTGLGLSLLGDATHAKIKGRAWFIRGTLGLIAFNAGLSIFGDAIKSRALYEAQLAQHRSEN